MKVKAIFVLAMIGIVTLSIVVSAYPTDHPYISNVIPPGGTHAPGEIVNFTAKIMNPTAKSYTERLVLEVYGDCDYPKDPDFIGNVAQIVGDNFTILPSNHNIPSYITENLSLPLNKLCPGKWRAYLYMDPLSDYWPNDYFPWMPAFNISLIATPPTPSRLPTTPKIMDPNSVETVQVAPPITPTRR
jgi:hypothetical protein